MTPINDTKRCAKKHKEYNIQSGQNLQSAIDCVEVQRIRYEDSCMEFLDPLCKSSAKMIEEMKAYKKYFESMDENWQSVNVRCNSSKDANDKMKALLDNRLTSVDEQFKSESNKLLHTQNKYSEDAVCLNTLVNKFCNIELQHPKHVGDTPKLKKVSQQDYPSTSKELDTSVSMPPTSSVTSINANKDSESSDSADSLISDIPESHQQITGVSEVRPQFGDGDQLEGSTASSEYQTTLGFTEDSSRP